jgi:hypothetical protein
VVVSKLHAKAAFDHQEHLVLVVVMVENEGAVELDELYVLTIEFGCNAGLIKILDLRKLVGDVDFRHGALCRRSGSFFDGS